MQEKSANALEFRNFEKCTVAMLGGPCSQHVTGNTSRLNQPQSVIIHNTFHIPGTFFYCTFSVSFVYSFITSDSYSSELLFIILPVIWSIVEGYRQFMAPHKARYIYIYIYLRCAVYWTAWSYRIAMIMRHILTYICDTLPQRLSTVGH